MTEERVFGETTIYYIEVKVGGRVLDVVEVWTGCANDPQWLADMKARFGQLGPGERHAVIKAVRDVAPKIAAQIREELAYAEEGPTKKEVRGYAEAVGATGAGLIRYRDSRMPCTFPRDSNCVIGNKYVIGENEWVFKRSRRRGRRKFIIKNRPQSSGKEKPYRVYVRAARTNRAFNRVAKNIVGDLPSKRGAERDAGEGKVTS